MSKARQLAQKPTQPTGRKNFLINSGFQVAQRGTSFTSQTGVAYHLDRWEMLAYTMGTGVYSVEQSTDAPDGFTYSNKIACTTADTTQDANNQMYFQQQIEAQNINWLKFYEANPDSVTVSFWVKSNRTGSFSATLKLSDNNSSENNSATRIYPFTYSISAANTWEKKTETITLDSSTGETKPTGNNHGMSILFWQGAGTNRDGATADAWGNNGNAGCASDNLDLLGSTSNNWYVTGVQIEAGTVATEFEHIPYADELHMCKRYFRNDMAGQQAHISTTSTRFVAHIPLEPAMRARPTASLTSGSTFPLDVTYIGSRTATVTAFDYPAGSSNNHFFRIYGNTTSTTTFAACFIDDNNNIEVDAEL